MDYYASDRDFFNFSTVNSFQGVEKTMYYSPTRVTNGVPTTLAPFSIKNLTDYFIGNYTFYYRRKLAKEGNSLSANVNLHYMDGDEYSDFIYEGAPKHENDENGRKKSVNMKVEHVNQLSSKVRLTVGSQVYYQKFSGTLSGAILGNDFSNLRYNAYADLFMGLKAVDVSIGLKAEQNVVDFNNTTLDKNTQHALFPTLILSRQLNKAHKLKAEISRSPYYPSAWAFSPYRIEIDSMTAFVGNPNLKPAVYNTVELSHSYRKRPIFIKNTLFYYLTTDLIAVETMYAFNTHRMTTYENSADRVRVGYQLTGSMELFGFIGIDPDIKVMYEEYRKDGTIRTNLAYSAHLFLSIGLPANFAIGGFGSYNGKTLYLQGYTKPNYSLDAIFVMKRFPKQHLFVYFALRGVTKSDTETHIIVSGVEEIRTFRRDTYGLAFRITYLFNRGKRYKMEKVNKFYESDKK